MRTSVSVTKEESGHQVSVACARMKVFVRSLGLARSSDRPRMMTEYSSPRLTKVEISVSPNISSSVRPMSWMDTFRSAARCRSIWTRTLGWDSR